MIRHRGPVVLSGLGLAAVVVILASIATGSDGVSLRSLAVLAAPGADDMHAEIIHALRVPRVLTAFACGGLLAIAGALMQVLFRNPLADPYILGLAGGAGTGALLALAFGGGFVSALSGGWIGALASLALLLWFGRTGFRALSTHSGEEGHRLLLTGVALASGWGAAITLVLALAPDAQLRGLVFWLMGDIDGAEGYAVPMTVLAIVVGAAMLLARDLNVMCLGADAAHALGVGVARLRLVVVLLASAAAGAAVTTAGTIGFIGLIAPNALRWWMGNDQRWLLPASTLAGGMLLAAADTIARSAIAPLQLPVGAIVAVIGVPVFIALVSRGRGAT
jgi:iron complex transport system permease protein